MSTSPKKTGQTPRQRARRGTLNPEVIVDAAIEVLNAEGLDRLTIGRVAQVLGVRPMALYTHFRDKDAILQGVAAELYGRFRMPELSGDPIDSLGSVARAFFDLLIENPALLRIDPIGTDNPADARMSEAMYECLLTLGLDARTTIGLVAMLTRYVIGSAYLHPARHAWDEDLGHWEDVRQRWAARSAEAFPAMRQISRDFPVFTQQEAFEFGLDALLRSIKITPRADDQGQPA